MAEADQPGLVDLANEDDSVASQESKKGGRAKDPCWSEVEVNEEHATEWIVTCVACKKELRFPKAKYHRPPCDKVKRHLKKCPCKSNDKNQSKIKTRAALTPKERKNYIRAVSHWFYKTGTPFSRVDEHHFIESQVIKSLYLSYMHSLKVFLIHRKSLRPTSRLLLARICQATSSTTATRRLRAVRRPLQVDSSMCLTQAMVQQTLMVSLCILT